MKKEKKVQIFQQVEIVDISSEGMGVSRINDWVVFVEGAVPGDICDIRIKKKKSSFAIAEVIKTSVYSPLRTNPVCQHFGVCGGCKWQHLGYENQIKFKEKQVIQNIKKIGKTEPEICLPILPAPEPYNYRNKLDFAFSNKKWLSVEEINSGERFDNRNGCGFHISGMFDKVLDIEHCYLQAEPSNAIRNAIKTYALENGLPFFNIREKTGLLRGLTLRNTLNGEWMLMFQFFENKESEINGLLNFVAEQFPQLSTILYIINSKANDSIYDQEVIIFKGSGFITEEMDGLRFRINPKSFFQTNPKQAIQLYRIALDFAQLNGTELVYDLYTGTGTIANFVARHAKMVIGVESVPEAIEDAKLNSAQNHISNTQFFAGDMRNIFTHEFIQTHGKPDVIITDPPRVGMHEDVIKVLLELEAKRIVYVSCNASTQARDIQLLSQKYRLIKMQPVDMFPQTLHCENVALLELIAS